MIKEVVFTRDQVIEVYRRMSGREYISDILKEMGVTRAVWNKYKNILVPEMKGKRVRLGSGHSVPQELKDEVNRIFEYCETHHMKFFTACEDLGMSHSKYSKWAKLIDFERYMTIKMRQPPRSKTTRPRQVDDKSIIAIMNGIKNGEKREELFKKYGVSEYTYYKNKMRITGKYVPYYERCVLNPKFRKQLAKMVLRTMREEKKTFVEACKNYKRYSMARIYDCIREFYPKKIGKIDFGFKVDINPGEKPKRLLGFENIEKKDVAILAKIWEDNKLSKARKRLHCDNCKLRNECKLDKLSLVKCTDRKLDLEYTLKKIELKKQKRIRKEGL